MQFHQFPGFLTIIQLLAGLNSKQCFNTQDPDKMLKYSHNLKVQIGISIFKGESAPVNGLILLASSESYQK